MRALLFNPGIHDFAAYDLWMRPLGLLRVGGILRDWGWEVELIDCLDRFHPTLPATKPFRYSRFDQFGCGKYAREKLETPKNLAFVERSFFRYGFPPDLIRYQLSTIKSPDLILIGTYMTYWYPAVKEAIELIRESFPGVPIILGGNYAGLLPQHALYTCHPDLVQPGRGAKALGNSLKKLGLGRPLSITSSPNPAFDLLKNKSALPLQLSRGCPFSCPYCAVDILEPHREEEDIELLADQVIKWNQLYKTRDFAFYDNALLVNSSRLLNPFLKKLSGAGLRFHIPNSLHIRLLNTHAAQAMKEAGVVTIRLSLESSQPEKQIKMGGKAKNFELKKAARILEDAGYERKNLGVYTILGYPGQTISEVREDIEFIHSLGLPSILAAFSPIPQTSIFSQLRQEFPQLKDPLYHNNSVFPRLYYSASEIRELRNFASQANRSL